MLLYIAPNPAPNPRRVLLYLSEKGLSLPTREIALFKGEHKSPEFLAKYPFGQLPALELDDGEVIGESVAICRYLEALNPNPPLFGSNPLECAQIDMWVRRIDLNLGQSIRHVWMHTHPLTAQVVSPRFADFGESHRAHALTAMGRIDAALAGKDFLAGDGFSIADIVLLTTLDFAAFIGVTVPPEMEALTAWHKRVSARPSVVALSIKP
jgi:glutathione S-transferase